MFPIKVPFKINSKIENFWKVNFNYEVEIPKNKVLINHKFWKIEYCQVD